MRQRVALILAALIGCSPDGPRPSPAASSPVAVGSASDAAIVTIDASSARAYPEVATDARAGEAVLVATAPGGPLATVEAGAHVTFAPARLVAPGPRSSTVRVGDRAPVEVANAAIVRLPGDARAGRGELVLTASSDARRGLELARVLAGPPATPQVVAIGDGFLRVDAGVRRRLTAGSFRPVVEAGGVGTGVALRVASGARVLRFVVAVAGDQVLVMRRSGELSIVERRDCLALPLRPPVAGGTTVLASVFDRAFEPMIVVGVDVTRGELEVSYEITERGPGRTVTTTRTMTVAAPMYWPGKGFPSE